MQSEIISIALEYSGANVDEVYVFFTADGSLYVDIFYRRGERIVSRDQLSDADVSVPRQRALIKYVMTQLHRLLDEAKRVNAPVPTQGRLYYTVRTSSLKSEFEYGPLSLTRNESEDDLIGRWVDEAQARLDR